MGLFDSTGGRIGLGLATGGWSEGLRLLQGDKGAYDDSAMSSLYNQRLGEISDFEKSLAGARQSYLNSVGNFYNNALTRYAQNAPAVMAAHGFTTDSGAFAAELARKTADYQAQLTPLASEWERQDLGAVNAARGQAWGARFGQMGQETAWKAQNAAANSAALGGFAGRLAMTGLGYALGGPIGGQLAGGLSSNMNPPSSIWGNLPDYRKITTNNLDLSGQDRVG